MQQQQQQRQQQRQQQHRQQQLTLINSIAMKRSNRQQVDVADNVTINSATTTTTTTTTMTTNKMTQRRNNLCATQYNFKYYCCNMLLRQQRQQHAQRHLTLFMPAFSIFLIMQLTTITQLVAASSNSFGNLTAALQLQQLELSDDGSGSSSSSSSSSSVLEGLALAFGASTIATTQKQQQQHVAKDKINIHAHPHALNIDHSIINFINRDNVLKRHNTNTQDNAAPAAASTAAHIDGTADALPSAYKVSSCPSCQMREKAKHDNLESIKRQILMRLQLTKPPNITNPIPVPHNIIENFYKNYGATGRRSTSSGGAKERGRIKASTNSQHAGEHNLYYMDHAHAAVQHDDDAHAAPFGSESESADVSDITMQGDDPFAYQQRYARDQLYGADYHIDDIDEEDDDDSYRDEFFSRVNSVYVFPTTPRIRHNRKPEILHFKFDNTHSNIVRAILHVYIRGRSWLREHDPAALESMTNERHRDVVITVHRAVRRANAANFTHTVKLTQTRHKIPTGLGQWVQIEIKNLTAHWTANHNATEGIIIKGLETWMRPLIVTSDSTQNKQLSVHIEVMTKDKRRSKRSTSLDCQESDHEVRCCRYPLNVNFTNFGWQFVVAPSTFDAYFCNGECKVGYLEQYTHTHIASLTTSASPCCSPTEMSPLKLLYFDLDQNLVLSTIPNMSVEKCSCS